MADNSDDNLDQKVAVPACTRQEVQPPPEAYNRIIMINVENKDGRTKAFPVHCGLLCLFSAYFNNLLNGLFREAGSDSIKVKDVTIETFELFSYWMYTGRFGQLLGNITGVFYTIVDLYIFGDFAMIPRLKNAALDLFLDKIFEVWTVPNTECEHRIYDKTPEKCTLRRFLVQFYLDWSIWSKTPEKEEYSVEFLTDLIDAIRNTPNVYPKKKCHSKKIWYEEMKGRICEFHDHTENKPSSPATSSTLPSDKPN